MNTGLGSSADNAAAFCKGTPYRVIRFLGRGGMGRVWVVVHEFLGREFALKVLHPHFAADARVVDRLRLEAQVTATLDHPNIVPVVDFWLTGDGQPCLVMELLTGHNLAHELAARRALPVLEVLEMGSQLLSAVAVAHRHGVLHRDIKPENIFLHDLAGQPRKARLIDFGLARVFRESEGQRITELSSGTRTGARVGSPRYMSPEARRGDELDESSDVYSVGATLYEALTGCGPFDLRPSTSPPEPPSRLVPGVATELDELLAVALAHDRADRLKSASEFESRLRALQPSRSRRVSVWPRV